MIISNPPYVLKSEVVENSNIFKEPEIAIFVSEKKPLIFYNKICLFAKKKLNSSGKMFFEINPVFEQDLIKLFKNFGYKNIKTHNDIFGKKRFIIVSST